MKSTLLIAPCVLLLSGLFIIACEAPAPPRAPMAPESIEALKAPIVLETYQLESGQPDRIGNVLQRVLQQEGNVEVLPGNVLLVAAPAQIHEGIARFISDGPKLEEAPREVVALDYWLVLGTTKPDALEEEDGSARKQLARLDSELDVIRDAEGYEHFTLLDHVRLATLDGEDGSSQSLELAEVKQTVSARGELFEARIDLKTRLSEDEPARDLETTIRLRAGESVVLGQAGYARQGVEGSVFYVVRAALQR